MIDLPSARSALCDAIQTIDDRLTVSPYPPKTVRLPHAWVEINTLEPATFGNSIWNVNGQIVVAVSESDDESAWETLDSMSPERLSLALSEATVETEILRITNYGDDIEIGGQAFRSFAVEFTVLM